MIRSRAPLRLGLAGGGTDLSPFCDEYGGAVLNCTIDRYAYCFLELRTDGKVVFEARDIDRREEHEAGKALDISQGLRLHRCLYNHFLPLSPELARGVNVATTVDAPAGSGLGSSSALVVAMCEAFGVATTTPLGLYDLAHLAYRIERIELDLAGGRQDQYAAAFGGMNFIEFLANDRVIVQPLRLRTDILSEIETSLVICFSGVSRKSEEIIRDQIGNMHKQERKALDGLFALKDGTLAMRQAVLLGDVPELARILNRSWESKKQTAGSVTSDRIEMLFQVGLDAGALAGKVSGAGGGGFLMFVVRPEDRIRVISVLNANGGNASPVHFTSQGVESWMKPVRR